MIELSNSIPDFWAISTIPLIKFVSSRLLNLKYFAPPIIDAINRGWTMPQASRIFLTFGRGVSGANWTY
jgi:hypothetical protein